ncbi:MAG: hypothetical protein RIS29_2515 [Bacteroidota bacterium]|jgi:hypothetical protein
MQYTEHINVDQGNFIMTDDREAFESILDKRPLKITDLTVQPGEMTTLYDWFFKPCLFVGFLENAAIFYLGHTTNYYYYDQTFVLSETRIFKTYTPGTARDVHLKKVNNSYKWRK